MHMSDALLSPAAGAAGWAGALGCLLLCSRKLKNHPEEKIVPLMGVAGAFIFAAQMINFTIPGTGSSGHLGGGMILAVLLGPEAGFLVMASVLTVQALFFADGGLLALGCNIWNLGFYPCFVAYPLVYRLIAGSGAGPGRITAGSILSSVAGLQLGAGSVVLQTYLSGRSELPFDTFLYFMLPVHLAIGLVEGVATAGVINYLRLARPGLMEGVSAGPARPAGAGLRRMLLALMVMAVITAGLLSWFASTRPDGLEWAIQKITGSTELPAPSTGVAAGLKAVQEKSALLPDYKMPDAAPAAESSWPQANAGTSLAGLLGAALIAAFIMLTGLIIRLVKRKRVKPDGRNPAGG